MKFFEQCRTLDELKKAYRAAAMQYHPDRGGSTEIMQAINAEYSARFEVLKRQQNAAAAEDQTGKTQATTESAGDFIEIINHLLQLDGLEIELCGRWLWIGGETRKHKDALKACGCRWSNSKKLWYWHFREEGEHWSRGRRSMSQIREKYGSQKFTGAAGSDALPA